MSQSLHLGLVGLGLVVLGLGLALGLGARDRAAYIARHRVNENHDDPLTPGALSRWLLWGESRSLARNTAAFRRRFRLQ